MNSEISKDISNAKPKAIAASANPKETPYHDVIIDDPVLTEHGFIKFRLPVNGNALRMEVYNDKYPSLIIYPKFDKHDIDKSVLLLEHQLLKEAEDMIADSTIEALVSNYRNACVLLAEDPDSIFFKNAKGKGKGNGNGKAKKKATSKQEPGEQEQEQEEIIQPLYIPFEDWQATVAQKYKTLYYTVQKNLLYVWPSLEIDLSIKNILHIKDCTLPFAGVVLGKPSSLKTVGIQMFRKSRHVYYTDDFTARSFVSHNSGLTEERLQQIDLLPKIRNKCFLTPELAPIFSAKEDDLIQFIGKVTRVLDGHGYENDSGAQGHRGYSQRMMFTWIGAAVDIPFKVHKVLTTLGPRLYFLRVPSKQQKSDDEYYQQLQHNDFDARVNEIQQVLIDYQNYFEACPTMVHDDIFNSNIRKMSWISDDGSNECQKTACMHIIKLGKLLAHLRGVVPTWHTQDTQKVHKKVMQRFGSTIK
jgi:hypothetical protein